VTCPDAIIQGATAAKTRHLLGLPSLLAIEAGAMPPGWLCRHANAATMPIHAAMPAMLQCPHSKHGPLSRSRAEGQRRGALTAAAEGSMQAPGG
jgi:hypothetical protein